MTGNRVLSRFCCGFLLLSSSSYLFSQQSNLQTSFFSPAAIHLPTPVLADVAETEHLPYIKQVAKDNGKNPTPFLPNASDLSIQQAEESFRSGRKYYRDRDFDHARREFDAAIDSMLKASENPTNRALYECKLEEMVDTIHGYDLSGMGAAVVEAEPQFDKAPLEDIVQMTFPVDPRITNKVQNEIRNTASSLPLVVNDVVLGYINYFNGRGRRTIEYGLARAGKYSAMISRVLAEEGVPQELIYLAQAESGFLPRAVSRAAAEGMWQFVKFRGNQYGLMQTPYSDDRFDPEKATRAAARHLHDLYNEFNDWYLAIAAYNCGPGCVEKAVERTGYADYWELRARRAIPAETTNYVPIILAMTIMAKNAAEYGLDRIAPEQPVEYDTVPVTSPTNLALIGDLIDTPTAELRESNPALLRTIAPVGFDLRVPKGTGEQVAAALELVPPEQRLSSRMHRVESGENLAAIARRYNASARLIASANNLAASEPAPGDRLLIPAAYHEPAAPVRAARATGAHKPATLAGRKTGGAHASAAVAKRPAPRTAGVVAQASRPARAGD
ncbi:MAG: transglycosylase SLT domain-containing protein [Bryobacteraceae bacterium]|jgi:membrane-bound lytic murein transglycosylase D